MSPLNGKALYALYRALLEAERDENTCRLDMKPSEKVALGLALEELERPKAEARERAGKQPSDPGGQGLDGDAGRVRETVGGKGGSPDPPLDDHNRVRASRGATRCRGVPCTPTSGACGRLSRPTCWSPHTNDRGRRDGTRRISAVRPAM